MPPELPWTTKTHTVGVVVTDGEHFTHQLIVGNVTAYFLDGTLEFDVLPAEVRTRVLISSDATGGPDGTWTEEAVVTIEEILAAPTNVVSTALSTTSSRITWTNP